MSPRAVNEVSVTGRSTTFSVSRLGWLTLWAGAPPALARNEPLRQRSNDRNIRPQANPAKNTATGLSRTLFLQGRGSSRLHHVGQLQRVPVSQPYAAVRFGVPYFARGRGAVNTVMIFR